MSSVRRVYYYLVGLITLGIFAGGVGVLLSLLFDLVISGSAAIGQSNFIQQQLSLGLAMLVIGGPLWFLFWRSIRRHVNGNNTEVGATLRKFYLNLILVASSLTAIVTAQTVLKWLISGLPPSDNPSGSMATLIVAVILWYYHWRISEGEGHPSRSAKTLRRWYIYIVSGWGLVLLTVGLIQFIDSSVRFMPIWGNALVDGNYWSDPIQGNITSIVLGGVLWAFHWFYMSRADADSTLRQVYLYLLAIVVSAIAGLVALTTGLYQTLVWLMGAAGGISGFYFQYLGWVIPTIIVTAAVWTYHQSVAQEEAAQLQERLLSSKRIHLYIMSFIGLGALTAGLIILIGTILNLIVNSLNPALALQAGWWQKQISLSLALLIVAVPLWLYYWNKILKLSFSGGVVEWRARSRRIYLYVIIGASIIALAADLVNLIYQFLSGALTGKIGLDTLQNSRWSIQSLLVAIPLLIYHWQIARNDQRRGAEAAAIRKTVTALIDNQSRDLIGRLEKKLGTGIHLLEYSGSLTENPAATDEDLVKLVSEIESSPTQNIMLVINGGKIQVLPYVEK